MKIKTQYVCQSCGAMSPKWLGRCPGCESWNSLVEEKISPATATAAAPGNSLAAAREEFRGWRTAPDGSTAEEYAGYHPPLPGADGAPDWVPLEEEEANADGKPAPSRSERARRISTSIVELDRVLGGGMVPDGFVLLGGDPGIGKSTLLLQMARGLVEKNSGTRILYVSGEESIEQIRGRARRLGVRGDGRIFLAAETQLERVFATVKELRPQVLVMDSLQTFSSGLLQAAPGSVSQVREIAARLMMLAKSAGIAVWLVGHVTKEGSIAGPKVVEHMVDTVLYFEGDGGQSYRLLRTVKNRFGSTRELGVFEMEGEGLAEVANPSSLFLSERKEAISGTAVGTSMEGSRPLFVELQGLVAPSGLAVPRRTSVGMDGARIAILAAVLERHLRIQLAQQDLFFNVAGGLRLSEPGCDLAAAAAIWSSFEEKPLEPTWVFLGEVALTGEVRRVSQIDQRLQEAAKLGFTTAVIPEHTPEAVLKRLPKDVLKQLKLVRIGSISELPRACRGEL